MLHPFTPYILQVFDTSARRLPGARQARRRQLGRLRVPIHLITPGTCPGVMGRRGLLSRPNRRSPTSSRCRSASSAMAAAIRHPRGICLSACCLVQSPPMSCPTEAAAYTYHIHMTPLPGHLVCEARHHDRPWARGTGCRRLVCQLWDGMRGVASDDQG